MSVRFSMFSALLSSMGRSAARSAVRSAALSLPLSVIAAGCTGDTTVEDAAARAALPLLSRAAAERAAAPAARTDAVERERHARPPTDPLLARARGRWLGTCDILLTGQAEPALTIEIERITEPTGTPGEFTWTLIYRDASGEQVRPYVMRADPAVPGRYLLDENNGIILSHYLQGGDLLTSDFDVPGVRLRTRELFRKNRYDFEIGVGALVPEISSDLGEGFIINSYRVFNTQKCTMRRVGSHGGGHRLAGEASEASSETSDEQ